MEYLLKRELPASLVTAAILDQPQGVLKLTIDFFQTIIANLGASFLSQRAVNKPLVRLVRFCVGEEDIDSAWGQEEGAFEEAGEGRDSSKRAAQENAQLDESLVGLMAFVASKLHQAPELLHIFFHDRQRSKTKTTKRPESPTGSDGSAATVRAATPAAPPEDEAKSYDFPLFNYLLRFVHSEEATGQLARAGLSVIVKIAFESRTSSVDREADSAARLDLASWILESDFVAVLGASLGAVYSLLPSKLAIEPIEPTSSHSRTGGMSLEAGDKDDNARRLGGLEVSSSSDPRVRDRLRLFVDILDFVQDDVLAKANEAMGLTTSLDTKALIAHQLIEQISESIRQSLLDNILYSAMVESGDRDGSSVAVLTYLEVLLSSLREDGPLTETVVTWLLREAQDDLAKDIERPSSSPDRGFKKGRKSAALQKLERDKERRGGSFADPLLQYTVKNLLSDYLVPTTSHASLTAALGVSQVLFARHGRFVPFGLVSVLADDDATAFPFFLDPMRRPSSELNGALDGRDDDASVLIPQAKISLSQHLREIDIYFSLATACSGSQQGSQSFSSSTGYERYLADAEEALSRDSMFAFGSEIGFTRAPASVRRCGGNKTMHESSIGSSFPAFRHRLDSKDSLLRTLLLRLRRFFEQSPAINVGLSGTIVAISLSPYRSLEGWLTFQGSDPLQKTNGTKLDSTPAQCPIVLLLLQNLVAQIMSYRSQIPDFDELLEERRRGLLYVENLNDALVSAGEIDSDGTSPGPLRPSTAVPSTTLATKERLWKEQGWESIETDVRVVDARLSGLPSRTNGAHTDKSSDADRPQVETKPTEVPGSGSAFSRLFGRSPAAKARLTQLQAQVDSSTTDKEAETNQSTTATALPFAEHYRQTSAITLEPAFIPMPKGPWTNNLDDRKTLSSRAAADCLEEANDVEVKRTRFHLSSPDLSSSSAKFESVGSETSHQTTESEASSLIVYPGLDADEQEEARRTRRRVTLSDVLDNVVILEEFVKQLAAIIQVRRSLGIDLVGM